LTSCFNIKNENDNGEMQDIFEAMHRYSAHFDCYVHANMHPPKSKKNKDGFGRGAGTSRGAADVCFQMSKRTYPNRTYCTVKVAKVRDGQSETAKCIFAMQEFGNGPALVIAERDVSEDTKEIANENRYSSMPLLFHRTHVWR
jgi:hypothetical protein